MDGWRDDGQMDGWMNDRWMDDGWMNGQMNDRCMSGWMGE